MATKSRKRKSAIARYFTPFGLKQVCDIAMPIAAILLIVGLVVYKSTNVVLIIGLCLFLAGSLLAVYRSTRVVMRGLNKRSPEYKAAVTNIIIMSVLAAFAIFGIVAVFVGI